MNALPAAVLLALAGLSLPVSGAPDEAQPAAHDVAETLREVAETLRDVAGTLREVSETQRQIAESLKQAAGAEPSREELDSKFQELVGKINEQTGARLLTVEELQAKLDAGEQVLLLDIREPREYDGGILPEGRLLIPDEVETAELDLPADATIVTYCTAGYRSGFAAVELEERYGRPVYTLNGGIIEWFNLGGEVYDPKSGDLTSTIDAWGEPWTDFVHPRGEPEN